MSLCAIGTPVSGVASPLAMRASAARACASVTSGRTSRKALRFLWLSMRPRKTRASSTAETSFAISAWPSSATDFSNIARPLLDDLGHEEQAVLLRRRVPHVGLAVFRRTGSIVAQSLRTAERMRHRFDSAGVHRLQLLDEIEDVVELPERLPGFRVAHLDTREMSDTLDVAESKCHFAGGFRGRGRFRGGAGRKTARPGCARVAPGKPAFC